MPTVVLFPGYWDLWGGSQRINGTIAEEKRQEYFAAVQAGLDKNCALMELLFAEIIERSLASM